MASKRPIIHEVPYTSTEVALEVIAMAGLLLICALTLLFWASLPAVIPTHFDFSGVPDAWGGKESLLIFPVMSLALYGLLTLVNRYPHKFNYLWPITAQNAPDQYRLAHALLVWLKLEVVLLFAYLEWLTLQTALGQTAGLGLLFLPLTLLAIFGTVGVYLYRAYQRR
jgi:hypothetical protein